MIIRIKFHEDLYLKSPGRLGRLMNELRCRMEMAEWKRKWREAEEQRDYLTMDNLSRSYEMVGLP